MRRIVAVLLALMLTAGVLTQPAAAAPAPPTAAATITIGWSVQFGSGYGYNPVVASNRSPSWTVYGESTHTAVLVFQADCNLVDRFNSVVQWASNSVTSASLRPCTMSFQSNGNVVIRNHGGQVRFQTGVVHTGTVYTTMAFYSNSCLVEFYWNAPTQRWLNQWSSPIGHGVDCSIITG